MPTVVPKTRGEVTWCCVTSSKSLSISIFHPTLWYLSSEPSETGGEICPNTAWLALHVKVWPMGPRSSGKTLFCL